MFSERGEFNIRIDQEQIGDIADKLLITLKGELGLPSPIEKRVVRETPIAVKNLNTVFSYWLVPIAVEDRLVGFLRLGDKAEILAYGRFGHGQHLDDFPLLSFLSKEAACKEIQKAFGDRYQKIESPQLVHDGPVDRIAWMSEGISADGNRMLLFWTFGSSYFRNTIKS